MVATLTDLKMELWLRRRNAGEIVWTTRNGDKIAINKMGSSHLVNTINYLERLAENRSAIEVAEIEYREAFESYYSNFDY